MPRHPLSKDEVEHIRDLRRESGTTPPPRTEGEPSQPTLDDLFPGQPPAVVPEGADADADPQRSAGAEAEAEAETDRGPSEPPPLTGVQAEQTVWNGRYSFKNFLGRLVLRVTLTIAWIVLAGYTWGSEHGYESLPIVTQILGGLLILSWLYLGWQVLLARMGHYYEITTKRIFVYTGVFHRRRDQVELLRVDDLYVKQTSLLQRSLEIGTVVIESSEERLPITYITGVNNPHVLMDLIWHHARTERDLHSVKVDTL